MVMDADGSHSRKLIGQAGDTFGPTAWSPDGRKLAFIRYIFMAGETHYKKELGIYDFENGAIKVVLTEEGLDPALAWTKDNRLIYSLREPPPNSRDSNVWALLVDAKTGAVRGPAQRLTDSPDRKVLASVAVSGSSLAYVQMSVHAHIYVARVPSASAGVPGMQTGVRFLPGNLL
jgi:Tol biopolymer transport system component